MPSKIKTSWDFSPLEKVDFETEKKEIEKAVNQFESKWKNNSGYCENPKILKEALDEYEKIEDRYTTSNRECYLWLKSQQDQSDKETKASKNKIDEFSKDISNKILFFSLNLSKLPLEKQKIFLGSHELLEYRHFLEQIFARGKYMLSEPEEKIMSLKDPVANDNWEKMVSELLTKEERIVEGKAQIFSQILSMMNDKNKKIRDAAAKAFNDILAKHKDVSEYELNSIIQDKKINDKIRNVPRPDIMRHIADDIETEIVDLLIKTVASRFDLAQRFYALKAKLLGCKKLQYHERNVSYGKIDTTFDFESSVQVIQKIFKQLDPEFRDIFDTALAEGRIDVYPKKGKRDGAFCVWWSPSKPVYVMLNHTNKLKDITTIAHEFGHAINGTLSKKQNALQYNTPISTTEVASTFMEDFVLEELIKDAKPEERLAIMIEKLNDDVSTIFRQVACYKFETDLHEGFRKKGYLPKEEINKLFLKNMEAYMGPAVEQSPGSENWWIYWSHIRRYFYVYSYASGLLISKSLQAKVKQNPEFIKKVKEFLSAGTSDSPKNIFLKLGIDISKKEFWLSGLEEIENLLNETEELARKLGKI